MSSIQPISTTRVTDSMTRSRLTSQIQSDQLDLFKLQNQLSTGRRVFLPSDDPAAAQRAMALQRTIERKEQSITNLIGAQASLKTTESSLRGVSDSLIKLKSDALAAIDSVASEGDTAAAIEAIDELFDSLVRVGNSTFTSNYLLGGAERATQPFARNNEGFFVEYYGDESSPQTYVDIGQLFSTGVSGDEVFGGLSEAVRGSVDLNPQLTPETRLDQLNGGFGVSPGGSIELTFVPTSTADPTQSTVIDLSQARTIDDVARLIERGAPEGANLSIQTQGGALQIEVDGGAITIGEVANGKTAFELGILKTDTPASTINGSDLDPTLRLTTRLDELVGARARGSIQFAGDNNDLTLTANANGDALNGVTVRFVDGLGSTGAVYDGFANELTVSIDPDETTASEVAQLITDEGTFTAEPDSRDQTTVNERGSGSVVVADFIGATSGGIEGEIDLASGLLITNGLGPEVIDTSGVETVEQLLSVLNDPQYGIEATINRSGDGIDVRTRRSGAPFTIGENGGTTATDLGIRTYTESSRLSDFGRGVGVVITQLVEKPGEILTPSQRDEQIRLQNVFEISYTDNGVEKTLDIDPIGLTTVEDLINRVNEAAGQVTAGDGTVLVQGAVTASLATTGNGLVLTRNSVSADPIDPAATAEGTAALAADTLTVTADNPGAAGNTEAYTIVFEDTLSGGLSSSIDGTTITIDLGGDTPGTDEIATELSGLLPDHTVASDGTAAVGPLPVADVSLQAQGGFDADTDTFTVSGSVAQRLGFFEEGETSVTSTGGTVASTDEKPEEVEGVFTTLARMREALVANDKEALGRELVRLEDDIERVTFGRAEVGVRLRNLDSIAERLADEDITLRDALSQQIDADFVEVISDFTAKQAALEASLQTSGRLLSLSILDFI